MRLNNYSFLDVAWSYAIAVLAPLYSCLGPGDGLRKWTLTVIGAAWSLRLGTHILMRVLKHHPKEDPRYQSLRKDWPSPFHFLLFFELQALIAVLLSLPFLLVAFDARPGLTALEVAGFAVAVLALAGEMTADTQMTRFVSQPGTKARSVARACGATRGIRIISSRR